MQTYRGKLDCLIAEQSTNKLENVDMPFTSDVEIFYKQHNQFIMVQTLMQYAFKYYWIPFFLPMTWFRSSCCVSPHCILLETFPRLSGSALPLFLIPLIMVHLSVVVDVLVATTTTIGIMWNKLNQDLNVILFNVFLLCQDLFHEFSICRHLLQSF